LHELNKICVNRAQPAPSTVLFFAQNHAERSIREQAAIFGRAEHGGMKSENRVFRTLRLMRGYPQSVR
jgi:hypothetical protein